MKIIGIFLALTTIFPSCNDDDNSPSVVTDPPEVLGMSFVKSANFFEESYTSLQTNIDANLNIGIVAEVNHTTNATSVELSLNPTQVIFFGNPTLGTPLMQQNQTAGLDLPQKILVYQNELNEVYLGFNNTSYLSARHGLENVATLPTIQGALTNFSTTAAGDGELITPENNMPELGEGIITKTSTKTFDETYTSLQTIIDTNPALTIIAEVNHTMNAEGAGMELNPTRLIIFGNPNLGTPLMQNSQTTALDLPQKMLVWEGDDNVVHVSYNDPSFFVQRHGITENTEVLATITTALNNLSNAAIME